MQFWAWILSAWKEASWKQYSWGDKGQEPIEQPGQQGGGGGAGTSYYPQSAWSMWDDPILVENNYKLLKQEDCEMFEILESLTLSGMI